MAGVILPGSGAGLTPQQALSAYYQQTSAENARKAQEQVNADEAARLASVARQRASDTQYMLMANGNNPRTTDGLNMTISNGGSPGRLSSYGSYDSSYGGSGSGGGSPDTAAIDALIQKYAPSPAPVSMPSAPARVAAPVAPTRAANTAKAFANAKNISGRQGQAAIRALHDTMTRRGMSDSGLEAEGEANILGDVANFNSDAAFRSDLADDDRTWDAAKLGFQGALSQRDADMGFAQSGYQGSIAQRAQDLDRQSLILNLISRRY